MIWLHSEASWRMSLGFVVTYLSSSSRTNYQGAGDGFALGTKSAVLPIFLIAGTVFMSLELVGTAIGSAAPESLALFSGFIACASGDISEDQVVLNVVKLKRSWWTTLDTAGSLLVMRVSHFVG